MWDERKRLINIEKHGYDFADINLMFFINAVFLPTKFNRLKAVNNFKEEKLTLIFKTLGNEALSIISLRPASKKERLLIK